MGLSEVFKPLVHALAQRTGLQPADTESTEQLAASVIRHRSSRQAVTPDLDGQKKRYIVAPSPNQKFAGPNVKSSLREIQLSLASDIVRSTSDDGDKVLNLTEAEAWLVRETYGGLMVEEDIRHRLPRSPLLLFNPIHSPRSGGKRLTIKVVSQGTNEPVVGAKVHLLPTRDGNNAYTARTDQNGVATLDVPPEITFARLIVSPPHSYWSLDLLSCTDHALASPIELSPLTPGGFDWGHSAMGATESQAIGSPVKVAIIDSGISPHPRLRVHGGKNFILGENPSGWDHDLDGHGTHCAGVIAAAWNQGGPWGWAPDVELYALRVFGGADGGGYASDIGNAIEWAISQGCDIINLSLGSSEPSSYLRGKIEKAISRGILCVAAAGNDGQGQVSFPAAFEGVLAISAVGSQGCYPASSTHQRAENDVWSSDQKYYLASFSNWGDSIDFCAPGVAITSTVPSPTNGAFFSAWDGTSMAAPQVSGFAARLLQSHPIMRQIPEKRASLIVDHLNSLAIDLGMSRSYQGSGFLRLLA